MSGAASSGPSSDQPSFAPAAASPEHERHLPRNLVVMALYEVVIRIGWIFKTESVIIPAFLDNVAGAGWLRGCLPVVNRFGQSVPPAFFTRHLKHMPRKKWALAGWTLAMAVVFLSLAGAWMAVDREPPPWMASLFLTLYALFSASFGLNQLAYGTVQGKLISVHTRGRLMAVSVPIGSVLAITFAWWLMGDWLRLPGGGFVYIFGFTGACFLVASVTALALAEPRDSGQPMQGDMDHPFAGAWKVLKRDRNYRQFGWVVMLASTTSILFPHYQAMAREQLNLASESLMFFVVVQNAAMGVFGLICGWLVHRFGERLALRVSIFTTALAPLSAVLLGQFEPEWGRKCFWLVFIPMGMTPVSQKNMLGYALEGSPANDHPRYLSTMSLCVAAPFLLSPAVGWLVDATSFSTIFLAGAAFILAAGVLTFRLAEPRHTPTPMLEAMIPPPE